MNTYKILLNIPFINSLKWTFTLVSRVCQFRPAYVNLSQVEIPKEHKAIYIYLAQSIHSCF